jgi:serine/threonine protein kinase
MTSSTNKPDLPGFVPNWDFRINRMRMARRGWHGITSLELAILGNNGIEKDFMDYLCSEPLVDADLWRPVRPLGHGGFGHVGLWHHKDQAGAVRDEMVIKEWPWDGGALDVPGQRGLAKEAVYQYQLNERNCQNVPTLRHFKYVHEPQNSGSDRYRTYSEFCPYGDLERLAMRYRAWGQYLPETFLWHVFYSMANVAREMSRPPWVNYSNMKNFPDDWSMIHFDIKPENILLSRKRR